jgi:SP family sugar:H+ symporter-like MFS transporter
LTPYANDGIGYAFGFVFFACNFVAAAVVYFFLFETKSLSLENVDIMYSAPDIKATTSKKWVPAGYITRNERDDSYWERRHSAVAANGGVVGDSRKEKYDDKDVNTSPERGLSVHQERIPDAHRG